MLLTLMLAAQAAAVPAPDVALDVRVHVRDVRIRRNGTTALEVRAEPDGGSQVDVDRPAANGRRRLRDVDVRVQAEARIADPAAPAPSPETPSPQ